MGSLVFEPRSKSESHNADQKFFIGVIKEELNIILKKIMNSGKSSIARTIARLVCFILKVK